MKTRKSISAIALASLVLLGLACTTSEPIQPAQTDPTPDIQRTVESAIQATLEALPAKTPPPSPTATMTTPPTVSPTATMTPAPTIPPSPTAIPANRSEPSPQAPTESALRSRAEEALNALSDEQWLDYYQFLIPAAREGCPAEEFAIQMGAVFGLIKGLLGAEKGEHLEFRLGDIEMNGGHASNKTEILFKGEPLAFGGAMSSDDEWVFIDGQWWIEVAGACEGFGL